MPVADEMKHPLIQSLLSRHRLVIGGMKKLKNVEADQDLDQILNSGVLKFEV